MRALIHPDDPYTFTEAPAMNSEQRQMTPFCVYRKGVCTDTVYFLSDMTSDEVRRSLIHRDGFPMDIMVRRGV